jgi:hypothetical protein
MSQEQERIEVEERCEGKFKEFRQRSEDMKSKFHLASANVIAIVFH